MFESLTERLGDVFDRLKRRGALSDEDVAAAMREGRVALLEADVALAIVRDFIAAVQELERDWGRIVFVSSESGVFIPPEMIGVVGLLPYHS